MAYRSGGKLKSYPNIQLVREAQKNAAFKARCAYWDLFTAMGGENAIINWSNRQPPLAQKDYTHFTRRGAKLVGEMLYNELMKEYNNYLTKKGVKNP
jgi:lysophospholipase L1-like esterase